MDFYWNSPRFQQLRRVNIEGTADSGCTGCHYFRNKSPDTQYFPGLPQISESASPSQRANWRLALEEFEANRQILRAKPLRYYVNFGFACNLSCIQCHQVPRRKTNGRQVSSEVLGKWRQDFKSALEVGVIGGEPFALAEALKFLRAFVADEELQDVRLNIYTNGTLHHRHMEMLKQKRKLGLIVSLDSIGDAYEYIRVDGKWEQVARNILDFIETGKRLNLDWQISTTCGLMKTAIPKLPEFAEWCGSHQIPTMFFEIISARGVEMAVADENVLAHPWLVRQIPGWKDYFTEAASIFRRYGMPHPAGSMEYFRDLIATRLERVVVAESTLGAESNEWAEVMDRGVWQLARLHRALYGKVTEDVITKQNRWWSGNQRLFFRPTHLSDHLASEFVDLPKGAAGDPCVRMTVWWPSGIPKTERCLVTLQDDHLTWQWEFDFERDLADGVVQRHLILAEKSRRCRIVLYAPETERSVLPTRIRIECRYEQHAGGAGGSQDLVQIASASN